MERTISEKSHSSCIGGEISSNVARSFRAQIKRHHELKFTEVLVYFFQNTSWLANKDPLNKRNLNKRNVKKTKFFRLKSLFYIVVSFYLPLSESKLIILFISWVDKIISSKTGTLPPTSPVLPPWGTTANLFELQYSRIFETCSVDFGRSTNRLPPNVKIK